MPIEARPKTYTYSTDVRWRERRIGVMAAAGKPEIEVATPPEFKGHAGIWSPEDLYVSAVNVCLMTTFLALAERAGVSLASYESRAEGKLELVDGKLRFTGVVLRPRVIVRGEDRVAEARALLDRAEAGCLISRSINAAVHLEPTVQAD